MIKGHIEDFLAQHRGETFPPPLLEKYEPIQCLSEKDAVRTFMLLRRTDEEVFVAKAYDTHVFSGSEASILRELHHPGIPALEEAFESGTALYVVRPYVPGRTLAETAEEGPLPVNASVDILLRLCGILQYLHTQRPAVIHRDIKPSNILLDEEGNVFLIDFEIARRVAAEAAQDTVPMLTRAYAAPEQFGYAQTDARSDIYSTGVVLHFLLSGSPDISRINETIRDRHLARIIKRCTAFAPAQRYQSIAALRKALLRADPRRRRRDLHAACALILAAALGVGGYLLGYRRGVSRPPDTPIFAPDQAVFESPLIEQAVRLQLGLNPGEPLTASDLLGVTELFIAGDRPMGTLAEYYTFWQRREEYGFQQGPITTLEDLRAMPNLWQVCILGQAGLTDISAVASLKKLTWLEVRHCPTLADISPVSGLRQLEILYVSDGPITDLSPLRGLALTELQIDGIQVTDRSPAAGLDLSPIAGMPIRRLNVSYTRIADFSPLLTLPNLEWVQAINHTREEFTALGAFDFEVILSENINEQI